MKGGSSLVAMKCGCSLILARVYFIIVGVNSVVVVLILSSGGVQAPLSLWCEVLLC